MRFRYLLILLIAFTNQLCAQYSIKGSLVDDFENKIAYLDIIDSWNGFRNISSEMILQSSELDSIGQYHFEGNELTDKLGFYRIRIIDKDKPPVSIGYGISIYFIMTNADNIEIQNFNIINDLHNNKEVLNVSKRIDSLDNLIYSSKGRTKELIFERKKDFLAEKNQSSKNPLLLMLQLHHRDVIDENFIEDASALVRKLDNPDYRDVYKISLERFIGQENYAQLKKRNQTQYYIILISLVLNAIAISFNLFRYFNKVKNATDFDWDSLTNKEVEVLALIAIKKSNKEMADALFVSEATIKSHVNNIYRKAGIQSRKEAVKLYNKKNSI